ncbi:MAG: APC family permease [Chitinophagales bacterium]|nr:APC family permease [Chitinophagales bacterium]
MQATAINMIDMVGIGPFVTIPLIIGAMNGPQSILAWLLGALLAFMDGFVWSELGAAMPMAGGSYQFLRKIYGEKKWGLLMSFLYIWQTVIQAPLVIASGAIGFAMYAQYLIPLSAFEQKVVAGGVIIVIYVLLNRRIASVGRLSVLLWTGVIFTIGWLIFGGLSHFDPVLAFTYPENAFQFNMLFFAGLGNASIKTVYSYLGYYNVCHLGGEIRQPEKNIPRSIFISIAGIASLYLLMQICILGVIPWEQARDSSFIVSLFFEAIYGKTAATIATVMILWIALSSLFAVMLGYSRVPYAAAVDGNFFSVFARVHPVKKIPHISLMILAATAFVFSLMFKLKEVITAIIVMRILIQFVGQAAGVIYLRHKKDPLQLPYRMWLYPVPAVSAIIIWLFIFFSSGWNYILGASGIILAGCFIFLLRARSLAEWPFYKSGIEKDAS